MGCSDSIHGSHQAHLQKAPLMNLRHSFSPVPELGSFLDAEASHGLQSPIDVLIDLLGTCCTLVVDVVVVVEVEVERRDLCISLGSSEIDCWRPLRRCAQVWKGGRTLWNHFLSCRPEVEPRISWPISTRSSVGSFRSGECWSLRARQRCAKLTLIFASSAAMSSRSHCSSSCSSALSSRFAGRVAITAASVYVLAKVYYCPDDV